MNKKLVAIISVIIALALVAVILFLTLGNKEKDVALNNNDTVTDSDDVKPVAPPDDSRPSADSENEGSTDTPSNVQTPDEPPVNPDTPDTPTEPDDPAATINPDLPTPSLPEPEVPVEPTTPAEPEVPVEPTTPTEPVLPDVPPTEPINPTQPDVPPTVPEEPAHVHSYDSGVITKKATCGAKGVKTFTCSCGDTKTEDIAKLTTHNYSKVTINRDATCKNEGLKTYTCVDCGNKKTETIPVLADHVWDKGELGYYRIHYTCQVCRETKTVLTCSHNWSEWGVAVPGSCVAGYEVKDCSICREVEKRPLPAVGHCVYEIVGHSPYARIWMCVGCYDMKEEALPEGNPDYKPNAGHSTPSNLPGY